MATQVFKEYGTAASPRANDKNGRFDTLHFFTIHIRRTGVTAQAFKAPETCHLDTLPPLD
jgi:hypothetical protein